MSNFVSLVAYFEVYITLDCSCNQDMRSIIGK